jgi:hypothetical protein
MVSCHCLSSSIHPTPAIVSGPRLSEGHYIRSMIAFSVVLGRIAAAHFPSSGK